MDKHPKKTSWFTYTGAYEKDSARANFILLICVAALFCVSAYILITKAKGPVYYQEVGTEIQLP